MAEITFTPVTLTSANMNTYAKHTGDAFNTYAPTLTQSATVTKTVSRAVYWRAGRKITGDAYLTVTGSGTSSNIVLVGLPVACASSSGNTIVGEGWIYDSSTGFFHYGVLQRQTSTTASFLIRTNGAGATYLGATSFTAGLASGDIVSIRFDYEAAS